MMPCSALHAGQVMLDPYAHTAVLVRLPDGVNVTAPKGDRPCFLC